MRALGKSSKNHLKSLKTKQTTLGKPPGIIGIPWGNSQENHTDILGIWKENIGNHKQTTGSRKKSKKIIPKPFGKPEGS